LLGHNLFYQNLILDYSKMPRLPIIGTGSTDSGADNQIKISPVDRTGDKIRRCIMVKNYLQAGIGYFLGSQRGQGGLGKKTQKTIVAFIMTFFMMRNNSAFILSSLSFTVSKSFLQGQ
jgi:hypothetical protein